VKKGALFTYGLNYKDEGIAAADILKEILVDKRQPSEIPVFVNSKYYLYINRGLFEKYSINKESIKEEYIEVEILTVPLQESLIYMLAVYGVYILFKTLKFPDISVDNVFSLGSMGGAFLLVNTSSLALTLGGTFIIGFLVGALTAIFFVYIKIPKLFAGIITYTILFSINLKFLGKSNISLGKDLFYSSPEVLWIIIDVDIVVLSGLLYLLKTILGKNLVSVGTNPNVLKEFGASYPLLLILGVGFCDALISTSGFLTSIYFRFSDTSLGIGILVNSVAAVILSQFIQYIQNKI